MAKAPANQAPTLAGFKLVNETKPLGAQAAAADPIKKFISQYENQLQLVQHEIDGKDLPLTKGGRRPRLMWFQKNGMFYVSLRYGPTPVKVQGMTTVEAGTRLDDVKSVFETLIKIAETDLRESIVEAAQQSRNRLGRKKAA